MRCPSGKRAYGSLEMAEEALLEAHVTFDYRSGSGPVAVYQCEECGNFHFTSSGSMNEKLATSLRSGEIKRRKEERHWQVRWRNKR
ncbi:MAG: hypothetical protein AB7K37_07875 [Cyclobacteriaceae bacterium]